MTLEGSRIARAGRLILEVTFSPTDHAWQAAADKAAAYAATVLPSLPVARVERELLGLAVQSSKNKFKGLAYLNFAVWTHIVLDRPAKARKLYDKAVLADPACERILRARRCFAARGEIRFSHCAKRRQESRGAQEMEGGKEEGLAMGGAREEAKAQLQSLL